jgi:hypothetical protein
VSSWRFRLSDFLSNILSRNELAAVFFIACRGPINLGLPKNDIAFPDALMPFSGNLSLVPKISR